MYSDKPGNKDESKGCISLVMDNNPGLPQVGSIIYRHKHPLEKDEDLKKIIKVSSVFCKLPKKQNNQWHAYYLTGSYGITVWGGVSFIAQKQ